MIEVIFDAPLMKRTRTSLIMPVTILFLRGEMKYQDYANWLDLEAENAEHWRRDCRAISQNGLWM